MKCNIIILLGLSIPLLLSEIHAVLHLSNLNDSCIHCLCEGLSDCDLTIRCDNEYCGPFYMSRIYWTDAESPVLLGDTPKRKKAFEDCANTYYCAVTIIKNYMSKYAKDCNGDGVTDCLDYAMIHINGGPGCSTPLSQTENGRAFLNKFEGCKLY